MFRTLVTFFFALFVLAAAAPTLVERAALTVQPACTGTKLDSHDCNVALLSLGGGIAGKIEFLRVNAKTSTGASGGCKLTTDAVDGGTAINISKGRLEQGFKSFIAKCGVATGTVTIAGGATGGNIKLTVSKNN